MGWDISIFCRNVEPERGKERRKMGLIAVNRGILELVPPISFALP